jgi:hypothetical protein
LLAGPLRRAQRAAPRTVSAAKSEGHAQSISLKSTPFFAPDPGGSGARGGGRHGPCDPAGGRLP